MAKHVNLPKEDGAPRQPREKKHTNLLSAESNGVDMFQKFVRCDLTVTHRFRDDQTHGENVAAMRDTRSEQCVSDALLQSFVPLSDEERADPRYKFATIGTRRPRNCADPRIARFAM